MRASVMHEAEYSKPMLWDNPEGQGGEGGGRGFRTGIQRGVQDGGTHVHSCQCKAKTNVILQSSYSPIKINKLILRKKTKIKASSPIISQQIGGEIMETVTDFILLGSKITANGDCSHEIKRHLLLGRKAMANLDSILKRNNIILPTSSISKSYGFSSSYVQM